VRIVSRFGRSEKYANSVNQNESTFFESIESFHPKTFFGFKVAGFGGDSSLLENVLVGFSMPFTAPGTTDDFTSSSFFFEQQHPIFFLPFCNEPTREEEEEKEE
jgi:hypothetical protein|tara:strand:- start:169 stop:480 length:312 start_codon:yes stop_codon:yes gene_type:complete